MNLIGTAVCPPSNILAFHTILKSPPVMFRARINTAATTASVFCGLHKYSKHERLRWRPGYQLKRAKSPTPATQHMESEIYDCMNWADGVEMDSQGKIHLKGLLFSETETLMERLGEKPDRAEVLFSWLYHNERLIRDVGESAARDDRDRWRPLGKETRKRLRVVATADGGLRLEDVQLAADGTRKLVSVLTSGEGAGKKVETVIIPMLRGPQKQPRYTICVSSQVGCAMNCQFCYTGRLGLMANLQTTQIVEQVLAAKRFLESVGDLVPVTGVVFMGMGEPFDNYERVMRAVKILTDPCAGVRLKGSSVTVSTVGLVPEIERFCADPDNRASLAISLHTVSGSVRDKVIPVNRRYPLEQLSETLKRHFPKSSTREAVRSPEGESDRSREHSPERSAEVNAASLLESKRPRPRQKPRILAVEYTLLGGVNDSTDDAEQLAGWLKDINCVVNLIMFNPHQGTPFSPSSVETSKAFRRTLVERGLLCTVRDSRGDDGMAACGQLGGESMSGTQGRKPVPVAWKPPGSGAIPSVASSRSST